MHNLKTFEIWSEGYAVNEGQFGAAFYGEWKGRTFKEAVQNYKNSLTNEHEISCTHVEDLNIWGCRLFDNEKEARKSFG